jgi:hypothetical protein
MHITCLQNHQEIRPGFEMLERIALELPLVRFGHQTKPPVYRIKKHTIELHHYYVKLQNNLKLCHLTSGARHPIYRNLAPLSIPGKLKMKSSQTSDFTAAGFGSSPVNFLRHIADNMSNEISPPVPLLDRRIAANFLLPPGTLINSSSEAKLIATLDLLVWGLVVSDLSIVNAIFIVIYYNIFIANN